MFSTVSIDGARVGIAAQSSTQRMPSSGHLPVDNIGQAKSKWQVQEQGAGEKQWDFLPKNTKRLSSVCHLGKRGDVVHSGLHRLAGDGVALHQLGSLAKRYELNGPKPIQTPE